MIAVARAADLVAFAPVQLPDADAAVTVADAGARLTAAGLERAGQDLPVGADPVAGTVGWGVRVPVAVVEVGVTVRHLVAVDPIDRHTGAGVAGGSIVAGIHLTSRDQRAELVTECANGGVAVISDFTDYTTVVMADIGVCDVNAAANKQQAESIPDSQPGRRYRQRICQYVAIERCGKRQVEAGYSHIIGGGECPFEVRDSNLNRDVIVAQDQHDGFAGGAAGDGDRRRRAHGDGRGGIGLVKGRCNREVGNVVRDAGEIVGGVHVKRPREHRRIAA